MGQLLGKNEVTSGNAWLEYIEAARVIRQVRPQLDAGEYDAEIRSALSSGKGFYEALFLLSTGPPRRLVPFLDLLVHRAVESGREMEHLRELLARVERALVEPHLASLVDEVLAMGEEAWYQFRPLAELLEVLDFPALLRVVVDYASKSSNVDIQEVAEDFGPVR
jgi:hypothetical protein